MSSPKIQIREWRPGDGLNCSFATRSTKRVPCGPPVAVQTTEHWPGQRYSRTVRHVVCALHLPGMVRPGEVVAEAEKAARERIAVAHWDEFQRMREEEIQTRVNTLYEFASEELRRIVTDEETH